MGKRINEPIKENEYVKELLALMEANKMPDAKELAAIIGQMTAMENHLADMVKEVAAIRRELAEAKNMSNPVKTAMQKAVISMQGQILDLRDKLAELKQSVIEGCKHALEAVREKGLSALRNITRFLDIRPGLESLRGHLDNNIKRNDAQIAKIEAMSAQYHEAGRHLVNIALLMGGKEPMQEAKPIGKLAKATEAAVNADRACLTAIRRGVTAAIGAVERLEQAERKPPVMETIKELGKKAREAQKDAPVKERLQPAHDER